MNRETIRTILKVNTKVRNIESNKIVSINFIGASRTIDTTINFSEATNGQILFNLPANSLIDKCKIEIIEPMQIGCGLTIGDDVAQGSIAMISDSDLSKANIYLIENTYRYSSETQIKAFFPTGLPTKGKIRIIINYN